MNTHTLMTYHASEHDWRYEESARRAEHQESIDNPPPQILESRKPNNSVRKAREDRAQKIRSKLSVRTCPPK